MKKAGLFALLVFTLCPLAAQEPPDDSAPLDQLLSIPVSTAAKYDQRMSDIPASVTIITAEEIARYGWHTLADVLSSVRGVYTTYDRGYSYLGVRGVGLPTDYNNRFLLLIDGYPMQEVVSGSVGIGTTLAMDLSAFSRIEFVRGPSSVVYGTGAMFGVINLITRDEQDRPSLMVGGGSGGTGIAAARAGFRNGAFMGSVATSWQEKNGGSLYFREFDSPSTHHGIVKDRDFDDYHSVLATFGLRDLRMLLLRSSRTKGVPTASWGTSFGDPEQTTDARTLLGIRFDRRLSPARQISVAASLDRFRYHGAYPSGPDFTWHDESRSTRQSLEGQTIWDVRPSHRMTFGARWTRNAQASYRYGSGNDRTVNSAPFSTATIYGQSEWQPFHTVTLTAGASYDRYSNDDGSHFVPRAGLVIRPDARTTWKLLHGKSFREATIYEEFFGHSAEVNLHPESITTSELVWEYRWNSDVLVSASLFDLRVHDVLRQSFNDSGDPTGYQNAGDVSSSGVEMQIDYRNSSGLWSYLSYSAQRTRENGAPMVNSPTQLVKAGVSTPTSRSLQGAIELLYGSSRRTLSGANTGNAVIVNLNLTQRVTQHLSAGLTVRNLFDTDYALPGGPEHIQDTLTQDGRSFLVRLRVH